MQRDVLIRFVTHAKHPPYGHRSGVLRASYRLLRSGGVNGRDRAELRTLLDWFNDHLEKPQRFSASRRAHGRATGISWIRASAEEHTRRLRRVAELIEAAGFVVDELRTRRPGYVLYEDAHQVIALPFADTPS